MKCFLAGSTITIKRFIQQTFDSPKATRQELSAEKKQLEMEPWTQPMVWLFPIDFDFY